jgi:hypothetical protein
MSVSSNSSLRKHSRSEDSVFITPDKKALKGEYVALAARIMNKEFKSPSHAMKEIGSSPIDFEKKRQQISYHLANFRKSQTQGWRAFIPDVPTSDVVALAENSSRVDIRRYAFALYHEQHYSSREAQKRTIQKYGSSPDHATIARSLSVDHAAAVTGRTCLYPAAAFDAIKDWILFMRSKQLLVDKTSIVTAMCNVIPLRLQHLVCEGGNEEDSERCRVTDHYYDMLWKRYPGIIERPSVIKPHEARRAAWAQSSYYKRHYDLVAQAAVKLNIAVWNPEFNDEDPESEKIFWTHPERVCSFDETQVALGLTKEETCGGRTIKSARAGNKSGLFDKGEVLAAKSSHKATGVGGSFANCKAIPARFILKAETINPAHCIGGPCARHGDKVFQSTFGCNDSGAAKNDETLEFIRQNIVPCLDPPPSAELGALIICDCYFDHYSVETLDYCRNNHIDIQLRVPNASSDTQNEDLFNFGSFKTRFYNDKTKFFRDQMIERGFSINNCLLPKHLISLAKEPWEHAFDKRHNTEAWRLAGLEPFTRLPYWVLKKKEEGEARFESQLRAKSDLSEGELNMCNLFSFGMKKEDQTQDDPTTESDKKMCYKPKPRELAMDGPCTADAMFESLKKYRDDKAKEAEELVQRKEAKAVLSKAKEKLQKENNVFQKSIEEKVGMKKRLEEAAKEMKEVMKEKKAAKCPTWQIYADELPDILKNIEQVKEELKVLRTQKKLHNSVTLDDGTEDVLALDDGTDDNNI